MKFPFQKYQGTGNDFVIIKASDLTRPLSVKEIQDICARSFGVGSDGLMIMGSSEIGDYRLDFYNPDGSQSFCGNGARCSVAYFYNEIKAKEKLEFEAWDGLHIGQYDKDAPSISVQPPHDERSLPEGFYCHTGSPHWMIEVNDLKNLDLLREGKKFRYDERFAPEGTNVNFLEKIEGQWNMRTYERGVENETLSCGTGATAAGLYLMRDLAEGWNQVDLKAPGGWLSVIAEKAGPFQFKSVYLKGSVKHVFNGVWQTLEG